MCCREEMATMLLLLSTLPNDWAANINVYWLTEHVIYTPRARWDECRFQCAQLYKSCVELNLFLGLPCVAVCRWVPLPCLFLGTPSIWGEGMTRYCKVKIKLKASFDVMTLKPSTINSKSCTVAANQLFPQVLWFARWSNLCGHWGAPDESSLAFISQRDVFHSVRT